MSMINDGNIAEIIDNALDGTVTDTMTIIKTDGGFDPQTAKMNPVESEHEVKGFREEYSKWVMANTSVEVNDRKFIITVESFPDTLSEIESGDRIRYDGKEYTVVNTKVDPSESIAEVQARL